MNGQYPLPGLPPSSIELVKRFQIYVTGDGNVPMNDLQFHILGFDEVDRDGDGRRVTDENDFTRIVRDFIVAPAHIPPTFQAATLPAPTPLDFVVSKPCCVILKLIGDFWEYTPNSMLISTKREFADARYRRSFPCLDDNGMLRGVGFFVEDVVNPDERTTRNGLNLYVDFIQGDRRLPVILDPDIENKGDGK